jgi:16S rRNA (guanine527-N7)-methyltransferase
VRAEVQDAEEALRVLGAELEGVYDVLIPDEPTRSLLVFHKSRPTPADYPRPVGVPGKKPL